MSVNCHLNAAGKTKQLTSASIIIKYKYKYIIFQDNNSINHYGFLVLKFIKYM